MQVQHQLSHCTLNDRYPDTFQRVVELTNDHDVRRVLSFGCSTGDEAITLKTKYFPDADIDGIDIAPDVVKSANEKSKALGLKGVRFTTRKTMLSREGYDVVFAMSALCRWPNWQEYQFKDFDKVLREINELVVPGGLLVLYNTGFKFSDAGVYKEYVPLETGTRGSGFVFKQDRKGKKIEKVYPYVVFRKNYVSASSKSSTN